MIDARGVGQWARVACWAVLLGACAHAPPPSARVHVVQKGDTPAAIARRYEVPLDALLSLNGIADPTKLQIGERLVLPGRDAPPSAPPSPSPSAAVSHPPAPPVREAEAAQILGDGGGADRDRASEATASTPGELPHIPPPPPDPDLEAMRATFSRSPRAGKTKLLWPVEGVVVSLFGPREGQRHDGVDIGAPPGTAIWAAADGEVVFAGEQPGYGRLVILAHDDDMATIYAHNAANLVKQGDRVKQGDPIAQVGQTGGTASPVLHFEVRIARQPKNPLPLLPDD